MDSPARGEARAGRIVAALAALIAGALGTAVSWSLITTRSAPETALTVWPWNAGARGEAAARMLAEDASPAAAARAKALATQALVGQALNVPAARALAAAQAIGGETARAARTMAYAESLSRRDLPTELWLIEQAVQRGDIAAVLRHYDHALRTSDQAPELLFPVLVAAASDPAVATPLARLVAQRPLWWRAFVDRLVHTAPASEPLALIVRAARLSPAVPAERALLVAAMQRLVLLGKPTLALAIAPPAARVPGLHNGGFEVAPSLLPFDWTLAEDADLGGYVEARPGGSGQALFLSAQNGRGGEIARQLVTLAPGRYRLAGTVGALEAGQGDARLSLRCLDQTTIAAVALPPAPETGRAFARDVTVPAGCSAIWIIVEASASLDGSAAHPWIDDLRITRR